MEQNQSPRLAGGRRTADKFLEACLLLLLCTGAGHGYALMEEIAQFGFAADQLNLSTLYRTLRHMEGEGYLKSIWETGGPGPKRRVYLISESGKRELDNRIRMMKARKARIEKLISEYDIRSEQAAQHLSDTV